MQDLLHFTVAMKLFSTFLDYIILYTQQQLSPIRYHSVKYQVEGASEQTAL